MTHAADEGKEQGERRATYATVIPVIKPTTKGMANKMSTTGTPACFIVPGRVSTTPDASITPRKISTPATMNRVLSDMLSRTVATMRAGVYR